MTWRIHVEPLTRPLFFAWSRLTRGKTLGVRAVAVDTQGRVLMVRHTYLAGWWLPGGGVDRGERTSHGEIAEVGWFSPSDLPADVNRGCRARLAEIFDGAPVDPDW